MPSASKTRHWYILIGIDVLADARSRAVVILGDSLTDGRGSTDDGNNRWPDVLADRFATNPPTADVAVINMGIGGNAIFGGLGPAAVNRFDRDVLNQSGVRYVIVFEGVNDLGGMSDNAATLTANLINAYTQFCRQGQGAWNPCLWCHHHALRGQWLLHGGTGNRARRSTHGFGRTPSSTA